LIKNTQNTKSRLFFYLIIAVIGASIYFWYQNDRYQYFLNTPVDETDTTGISFIIAKGQSTATVSENLLEKELILDKESFRKYTKENGIDKSIIAGRFILNKTMTIPEIAQTLTDRRQSELTLTITEGSTVKDIDKKLVDLEVIEQGAFEKAVKEFTQYEKYPFLPKNKVKDLIFPLEGYLFPDTYFIDTNNFYSENLIQLMLKNFERKISELSIPTEKELHQYIIMASIIEKEVRTKKDIHIVAGILWKRLNEGWLIGADATLLYLKDDRTITYKDLQENSAYNTRKLPGLPPGPISNPGLATIKGAMEPEPSEYYFYLTKPESGEVVYGKTNDEHNRNKLKFL
jgi:UPF0755 protein